MDIVTYALLNKKITDTSEFVEGLASGFTYKGSVATTAGLPSSAKAGDMYTVTSEDNAMYVWDGDEWVQYNKGTAFKYATISLGTTWTRVTSQINSQTVTLNGYTPSANTVVDILMDDTVYNEMLSNGVLEMFVDNTGGTIEVIEYAGTTKNSLTLKVACYELQNAPSGTYLEGRGLATTSATTLRQDYDIEDLRYDINDLQDAYTASKLNVVKDLSSTSITLQAQPNTRYIYGELSELTLSSLPSEGIVNIVFQSGTTPTVFNATGTNLVLPSWWSGPAASTTVMLGITDGVYGSVQVW